MYVQEMGQGQQRTFLPPGFVRNMDPRGAGRPSTSSQSEPIPDLGILKTLTSVGDIAKKNFSILGTKLSQAAASASTAASSSNSRLSTSGGNSIDSTSVAGTRPSTGRKSGSGGWNEADESFQLMAPREDNEEEEDESTEVISFETPSSYRQHRLEVPNSQGESQGTETTNLLHDSD